MTEDRMEAELASIAAEYADLIRPGICRGSWQNGRPCRRPCIEGGDLCRVHSRRARQPALLAATLAAREKQADDELAAVGRFLAILRRLLASYRVLYPDAQSETFEHLALGILGQHGYTLKVEPIGGSHLGSRASHDPVDRRLRLSLNPGKPEGWRFLLESGLAILVENLEDRKMDPKTEFPAFRAALRLVWDED